jgi:RNA polymerase sigma-70 factor (ECF subfamily)
VPLAVAELTKYVDNSFHALLALLLLTDARRRARTDADGEPIALDEQDRTRWNRARIAEGRTVLMRALRLRRIGPYQLQAAIAAQHAAAPTVAATDWPRVAALYRTLAGLDPSPVVTINRAVAVGRADGPDAGLALLAPLTGDARLARYQPLHAAHADLLRRSGDAAGARAAYDRALALTTNARERAALARRADAAAAAADGAPPTGPARPTD